MTKSQNQKRSISPGEPYVWLTAMGLTVGLFMIIFLLGLVVVRGLNVFWPSPIVEIHLSQESDATFKGAQQLAGEIFKKKETVERKLKSGSNAKSKSLSELTHSEWKLFVANSEVYGLSFTYVDKTAIRELVYPTNIFRVERMENGPAIGYPVAIEHAEEGRIPADSSRFRPELVDLVDEVNARRRQIRALEEDQIGEISTQIHDLKLRKQYVRDHASTIADSQTRLKTLESTKQRLEKEYKVLAAKAAKLREAQSEHQLVYRLTTGSEQTIPMGQVVHFYFPNQLTGMERIGLFFQHLWTFLSSPPREANTDGGIYPAIFGTFVMTVLMSIAVTPFGVLAAIYLREYAKQGTLVRGVRIAVNNLAGVPSIVFGAFGLGFFVYFVGGTIDQLFFPTASQPTFGTGGILWASLTLALLTVPVVIVSTEEALAAVPRGAREGSLACGASKWQTIRHIVLPASAPGILTGVILAMARGAGEVAPLMLVGVVKLAPSLPINDTFPYVHLDQKFMHLGFHIYDLGFQSPDSEAAKPMVFATTLVLISLVVALNLLAIFIRERLRGKYSTGQF